LASGSQETWVSWLPEADLDSLASAYSLDRNYQLPSIARKPEIITAGNLNNPNRGKLEDAAVTRMVYLSTDLIQHSELSLTQKTYLMSLIQDSLLKHSLCVSAVMLICNNGIEQIIKELNPRSEAKFFKEHARKQYIQNCRDLYGQIDINVFMRLWKQYMTKWHDQAQGAPAVCAYGFLEEIDQDLKQFDSEAAEQPLYQPSKTVVEHFAEMVVEYYDNMELPPFSSSARKAPEMLYNLHQHHPLNHLPLLTSAELWQEGLSKCLEQGINNHDNATDELCYIATGLATFLNYDFRQTYDFFRHVYRIENSQPEESCIKNAFQSTASVFRDNPHVASTRQAASYTMTIKVWRYIEAHIGDNDFLEVLLSSGPISHLSAEQVDFAKESQHWTIV